MGVIRTGETDLSIGTISDGEYLKRSGTDIISAAAGGGGGGIAIDTFSNRPAAGTAGAEFVATDTYMPVRCIDNGMAWKNYYNGFLCTDPPAASSLSQIGFSYSSGSATLADVGDGLLFTSTGNNSTSARNSAWAVTAIPESGAYSLTVGMILNITPIAWTWGGLVITDGNGATPKGVTFILCSRNNDEDGIRLETMYETNPTTYNSGEAWNIISHGPTMFMRMSDDRTTNITTAISYDGINFTPSITVARTAFLTPAYIGVCLGQTGGATAGARAVTTSETRSAMRIFHWSLG